METTDKSLGRAWRMVAALFAIYVFSWLDRLAVSMLVTPIKDAMALTDVEMSLVLGPAFAFAYAVFGVPLGWAADRFPRRLVIFCGVLVWASATVACGLVSTFPALLACRVVVGIGEAALLPAAYSLIGDAFPPNKVTVATSVFQSAGKTGSAAAFGLGGIAIAFAQTLDHVAWPLVGEASYWQITFWLVGIPGFALAFLALTFPEPARRGTSQEGPQPGEIGAFFRKHGRLAMLVAFAFTCLAMIGYSLTSWVPSYMDRHFGWQPARYGVALSMMNILGAVALIACGRIVDRLFTRGMRDAHLRFYTWTILTLSPAILFAFLATNPYVFLACYALIQIITVPFIVYGSAIIALLAPSHLRGQLLGLLMFVFNIAGFGGGPALIGFLTDHVFGDEAQVGKSLAVVTIGGAVLAFLAMRIALPLLRRAVSEKLDSA
ncbi:MAG: MFS transporter [Novosphingobium sp.]|nr:MFS transporter [Novosphingobium sp.]